MENGDTASLFSLRLMNSGGISTLSESEFWISEPEGWVSVKCTVGLTNLEVEKLMNFYYMEHHINKWCRAWYRNYETRLRFLRAPSKSTSSSTSVTNENS